MGDDTMRGTTVAVRRGIAVAVLGVLVAALALTEAPADAYGSYWDDDGGFHEPAIEAIAAAGITTGCGNGKYCPDQAVTREQMATFLVRALGLPTDGTSTFSDIAGAHAPHIRAIADAGITTGCGGTSFCPRALVTRAEMATFIARGLDLAPGTDAFSDDDGSVHEADIDAIAAAGITTGCGGARYCPAGAVTRAEMASFLARALGLELIDPIPTGYPDAGDVALVSRYHVLDRRDGGEVRLDVDDMRYSPRSMRPGLDVDPDTDPGDVELVQSTGPYAGWDVLLPANDWKYRTMGGDLQWMNFTLTRPATVAVVWRGELPLPSWLAGWSQEGTVGIDGELHPVYRQSYPAGPVRLGTVEASDKAKEMYVVLIAEADGTPTLDPPVPAGFPVPVVNDPCPSWVHDRHRTTGPDGQSYGTWHPQLDPVYWCSFGHEHGSDPARIPGAPMIPYQYVAGAVPQDEPDMGFKEYTFREGDHWVRIVMHGATHSPRRVCARLHTMFVSVYDSAGTELMNVGYKADFGAALSTDGPSLDPTGCGVHMPTLADQLDHRFRKIRVGSGTNDYERWQTRQDLAQTRNLGIAQIDLEFDMRNPITHCANLTCDTVIRRDISKDDGTRRTLTVASWKSNTLFSSSTALGTGEFFTDPYGNGLVAPAAANAVRQYVSPGFSLGLFKNETANRVQCVARDPWIVDYTCHQVGGAGNLDHLPHVPSFNIEEALWNN